jgi:hypothetical protein
LVINEIHADPHPSLGDANGDGIVDFSEDVFIEVVNPLENDLDISGWKLRDVISVRHTFPSGSIIPSRCAVLVFGGGEPVGNFGNSLVQLATSGGLSLGPSGDSVSLVDSNGVLVTSYSYGVEASDSQSLTRSPDILGSEPLVKHSTAEGSGGALFSPGTRVDGYLFDGCPSSNR